MKQRIEEALAAVEQAKKNHNGIRAKIHQLNAKHDELKARLEELEERPDPVDLADVDALLEQAETRVQQREMLKAQLEHIDAAIEQLEDRLTPALLDERGAAQRLDAVRAELASEAAAAIQKTGAMKKLLPDLRRAYALGVMAAGADGMGGRLNLERWLEKIFRPLLEETPAKMFDEARRELGING